MSKSRLENDVFAKKRLFWKKGPKSSLKAHIWSKHTAEDKKPFQCPCHTCNRGFAARANLIKHVRKEHNIILPKKKR